VQVKPWNQMINISPNVTMDGFFVWISFMTYFVWLFSQLFHKGLCPLSLQRNTMFILTYWALGSKL
jgi:hypothetical protein